MRKILVVEDDVFVRRIFTDLLKLSSVNIVFEASNGKEALDILKMDGNDICLIISDLKMPQMDGLTFLVEVLKDDNFKNIPFIAISGGGKGIEEFKKMATVFIQKPVLPSIFLQKIEEAL